MIRRVEVPAIGRSIYCSGVSGPTPMEGSRYKKSSMTNEQRELERCRKEISRTVHDNCEISDHADFGGSRPDHRGSTSVALALRWSPLIGLIAAMAIVTSPVVGRDLDGRYKDSSLHDWFEHLASGKGLCCSFADGYAVEDADWKTTTDGKHYRVRVPHSAGGTQMDWVDVPDEAVITEPNRVGRTMVWPLYGDGVVSIRCFMPGSMT